MAVSRKVSVLDPPIPVLAPSPAIAMLPAAAPAIHVERIDGRGMARFQPAWSDLFHRAAEPNVFLDPAFALPLLQHFRFDPRPDFLLAWEADGPASFGKLIGLLPVHRSYNPVGLMRAFRHRQVALGTPLLDAVHGTVALEAILAFLDDAHPGVPGLVLADVPEGGAFHQALRSVARKAGRGIEVLDRRTRAVLRHDPATPIMARLSGKKRKELRRQRRRLGELGQLAYVSATTPSAVRRATERFLALESRGWKGRRGSALLADPSLATFTRTMTRLMAHEGRCRIDSLELDGEPVAMGILLSSDRDHFWKTSFDERHAALSPGVLFALDLSDHQAADAPGGITDSCAVPDHPMIDRIWPDRLAMIDLVVAIGSRSVAGPGVGFRAALWLERLRRRVLGLAKAARHRLRGGA